MNKFTDPKTGKQYDFLNYTQLSQSVAETGSIDGVPAVFTDISKIPYRLVQGDQSKYFDRTKVEENKIIRKDDGIVYIPITKGNYKEMIIGYGSEVSRSFLSEAYLQVSAAFDAHFMKGIPNTTILVQATEEFYQGEGDAYVGPVTASLVMRNEANEISYSGIDNGSGVILNFDLKNSSYVTHTLFKFQGGPSTYLEFKAYAPVFPHLFQNNGSLTGSIVLADTGFNLPVSGTLIGEGIYKQVNKNSPLDGTYMAFFQAGRLAGDGDFGTTYDFLKEFEIVVYPSTSQVVSGSFKYVPFTSSSSDSTGSNDIRTLYYTRGTTGPDLAFTGSNDQIGSLCHKDINLEFPADYGWYYSQTTNEAYEINTSSIDNMGIDFSRLGIEMIIPRFISKVSL